MEKNLCVLILLIILLIHTAGVDAAYIDVEDNVKSYNTFFGSAYVVFFVVVIYIFVLCWYIKAISQVLQSMINYAFIVNARYSFEKPKLGKLCLTRNTKDITKSNICKSQTRSNGNNGENINIYDDQNSADKAMDSLKKISNKSIIDVRKVLTDLFNYKNVKPCTHCDSKNNLTVNNHMTKLPYWYKRKRKYGRETKVGKKPVRSISVPIGTVVVSNTETRKTENGFIQHVTTPQPCITLERDLNTPNAESDDNLKHSTLDKKVKDDEFDHAEKYAELDNIVKMGNCKMGIVKDNEFNTNGVLASTTILDDTHSNDHTDNQIPTEIENVITPPNSLQRHASLNAYDYDVVNPLLCSNTPSLELNLDENILGENCCAKGFIFENELIETENINPQNGHYCKCDSLGQRLTKIEGMLINIEMIIKESHLNKADISSTFHSNVNINPAYDALGPDDLCNPQLANDNPLDSLDDMSDQHPSSSIASEYDFRSDPIDVQIQYHENNEHRSNGIVGLPLF